jgi:hypothetical protein
VDVVIINYLLLPPDEVSIHFDVLFRVEHFLLLDF